MAELFSEAWMTGFLEEWNKEPELTDALAEIGFESVIGYGLLEAENPAGVIRIEQGRAVAAGAWNGEELNWDLRASAENWNKWLAKGIGMAGLGIAYTTGKLKFRTGDYGAMLKDPRMAAPFVKSFAVMGRV